MIKSKDNGITLITAIIAIVLILILVGVGVNSGINMYTEARVKKFVEQMQLIQAKVDERVNENETNGLGIQVTSENKSILLAAYNNEEISNNTEAYFNSFKYFSLESLKNDFELENIDNPILINFSTREVVSTKGVDYKGTTYYTQYLLEGGQKIVEHQPQQRVLSWNISKEIDGLNCLVKITNIYPNATLAYGELENSQVNTWNTLSTYTKANEEYTVNITKTGEYVFKVTNNETNISEQETVSIVVTNKPNTDCELEPYDYSEDSTKWVYVTVLDENDDEELYVWLPRFAINNTSNNTKYVKGNSNIATDNTYINIAAGANNWSVPSIFKNNNEELNGIWIKVNSNENLSITNLANLQNPTTLTEIKKEQQLATE